MSRIEYIPYRHYISYMVNGIWAKFMIAILNRRITGTLRPSFYWLARSDVVLCDVVFPSKQAGKVDGFLDRHQIAVVSAVEPNSAGAKFPVVMSVVTPLVEYFHSLITTNCREREQKDLSSISLMRRCLYRCSNGFPISDFPRQRRC